MKKRIKQFLRVRLAYLFQCLRLRPLPTKKFVIFGQGRTGSTLLVDLLNSTPDIHCDREIFNIFHFTGEVITKPLRYINGRARRYSRQVYGFKVKVYQLKYDHKVESPTDLLQALARQGYSIIYLCREQVLNHAYSNVKRSLTGVTHVRGEKKAAGSISVPVDSLLAEIRDRLQFKKDEMEVLEGMSYLPLVYEKDLLDPDAHLATVNSVRKYVGLAPVESVRSQTKKIIDKPLSSEITNYEEVVSVLKDQKLDYLIQ